MHWALAVGFAAALLLICILLACLYHRRIRKLRRVHEFVSKRHTEGPVQASEVDFPDLIYGDISDPVIIIVRPQRRKPLQTLYPARIDSCQPSHLPEHAPDFSGNGLTASSLGRKVSFLPVSTVIPADSNSVNERKERRTPLQFLKSILNKSSNKEPFSEGGYLKRQVTIKSRDRASSFPFLYRDESNSNHVWAGQENPSDYFPVIQPDYLAVEDAESYRTARSRATPRQPPESSGKNNNAFYTPSPESVSSVPVTINLEDCAGEDGCKFVRTISIK